MDTTIAKRAKRPATFDETVRRVALAMCNAERAHHMLSTIETWDRLTDEAQAHYMRLAAAALLEIEK